MGDRSALPLAEVVALMQARLPIRFGAPDDFAAFCRQTGHVLLESTQAGEIFTLVVQHK